MNRYRNQILPILVIATLAVIFSGCSTANQDSPLSLVDDSGNHPDSWIAVHGSWAAPDGSLCVDCHGDDLTGGITGVSCFSVSYNGLSCHAGGPAFHPADWLNKSASGSTWHADAFQIGIPVNGLECVDCHTPPDLDAPPTSEYPDGGKCLICHFTLGGSRTPGGWTHGSANHSDWAGSPEETVCVNCHDINISFGNQEFCHNCHEIVVHDVPYLDHYSDVSSSGDFDSQCSMCHSMTGTSPNASAPECVTCHVQGSPYTQTNCRSCHGRPPSTGEHGEHGNTCSDCHQGAGTGSGLNHFYDEEVDVVFSVSNFTYSGGNCTGTCHEYHDGRNWL